MVEASPELRDLFRDGRRANQLIVPEDGSFLKPVSSEKRGLDGKRVHGALMDELHEQPTPIVVNKMRAGTKGMRNALIVKTTNSGFDRTSVCWSHHEYSRKVLDGTLRMRRGSRSSRVSTRARPASTAGKWFPADDCPTATTGERRGRTGSRPTRILACRCPGSTCGSGSSRRRGCPRNRATCCASTSASGRREHRAIDMGRWMACAPMPSDAEFAGADCFGCFRPGRDGRLLGVGPAVAAEGWPRGREDAVLASTHRAGAVSVTAL
jgi:hypothetical protein